MGIANREKTILKVELTWIISLFCCMYATLLTSGPGLDVQFRSRWKTSKWTGEVSPKVFGAGADAGNMAGSSWGPSFLLCKSLLPLPDLPYRVSLLRPVLPPPMAAIRSSLNHPHCCRCSLNPNQPSLIVFSGKITIKTVLH